jgi:hypothetical protein
MSKSGSGWISSNFFKTYENRVKLHAEAKKKRMKTGIMSLAEGHPTHLLNVMRILKYVWENEITAQQLSNCWFKSELLYGTIDFEDESDLVRAVEDELKEFANDVIADASAAISADAVDEQLTDMAPAVERASNDANAIARLVKDWAAVEDVPEVKDWMVEEAEELSDQQVLLEIQPEPDLDSSDENIDDGARETVEPTAENIEEMTSMMDYGMS